MESERRIRPGELRVRPGLEAPPDRVPNPVIVVGIGRFGHEVVWELEQYASTVAEVLGPAAVRNLATYRILQRSDLLEAVEDGFAEQGSLRRGLQVDAMPVDGLAQFFAPGLPVSVGLDATSDTHRDVSPYALLEEGLTDLAADLFRVDRFVDYHADSNQFVSRLDLFVVGEVDEPLAAGVHCGLQRALSVLVTERLAPLFKEYRSNISMTHLAAFPLVRVRESKDAARSLVAHYRDELRRVSGPGRAIPARFLFLEDRSHKYVLSRAHMVSVFENYVRLLTFGRAGREDLLRDLLQPLPTIARLRNPGSNLNNLCGSFTAALIETPLYKLLRYCRNRQAIAVLNVFLDRPQDGEEKPAVKGLPAQESAARVARYGRTGSLAVDLHERILARLQEMEADRRAVEAKESLRDWQIREYSEWAYHGSLVRPFHNDLEGEGSPQFTLEWLKKARDRIIRFLDSFVTNSVDAVFREIEREGEALVKDFLLEERQQVDALVEEEPAGWKRAFTHLEHVVKLLGEERNRLAREVQERRFREVGERTGLVTARGILDSFTADVDTKPVRQRFLKHARVLGTVAGVAAGTVLCILVPIQFFGIGMLVPATAVAGWVFGKRWAEKYNRQKHDELRTIISPDDNCQMVQQLDRSCDELLQMDWDESFLGERVAWSFDLWRLKFYNRVVAELELDLERLRDIGRVLSLQLNRFRADQENIGVRYSQDGHTIREDTARVIRTMDVFRQAMIDSSTIDGVYGYWVQEPYNYALHYIEENEPFKRWRSVLPFAYYRELTDFHVQPFLPMQETDFLAFDVTREEAQKRTLAFLGDFANKIEIQAAQQSTGWQEGAETDKVTVFHEELRGSLRELLSRMDWPKGWAEASDLGNRQTIYLLRHVQGLAPWDLPAIGDQMDLVRELVEQGYLDTLHDVISSVRSPTLVTSMVAVALAALAESYGRTQADSSAGDWQAAAAQLLRDFDGIRETLERPIDGARFVDPTRALEWITPLAGTPGLLPLVCRLFGTAMDPSDDPFATALLRCHLLRAASRDEMTWVYKRLKSYPDDWVDPHVRSLVHAETVIDLLLQKRLDDALTLLQRLTPDVLALSCSLRAILLLHSQGDKEGIRRVLGQVHVPDAEGGSPLPKSMHPPFQEVVPLVKELQGEATWPVVLAGVYGPPIFADLDRNEEENRVTWLLAATPGEDSALLRRILDEFPSELLDPALLSWLRRKER